MKKFILSVCLAVFGVMAVGAPVMAANPSNALSEEGVTFSTDCNAEEESKGYYFLGMRPWFYGLKRTGANCDVSEDNFKGEENLKNTAMVIILNIVKDVMIVLGILALGFLLFGAYRYIRAGGDAGMLAKGKRTITTAVIGLVMALMSEVIVNTIGATMLSGASTNSWGFYNTLKPSDILNQLISFILTLLGVIAVGFVIASGIQMATAGGDPGKLQRAKSGLVTAVIGVAIATLGSLVVNFLIDNMGTALTGNESNMWGVLDTVFTLIALVAGFVALCGLIYGGVMYTTSAGDSSKMTKGKNAVIWSTVGIVIVVFASVIINFVVKSTGVEPEPDPSVVILDEE